jgi:glucokinase
VIAPKDNPGSLFAGIDIGGTSIKWMIVDEAGREVDAGAERTDPGRIAEQAPRLVASLVAARPRIAGVGASCPGIIDEDRGRVLYASNLELTDVDLRALLEGAAARPTGLIHDGRAAGLAEGLLGAGRGASSFVMIPIGTGISAAFVLGDLLWAGATFSAGEIGHAPVFHDGELCTCGQRGCLEVYASAKGLARRYATATGEDVGARGVQARLGSDPVADEVWGTAVRALAISLAQLTLGLDPQRFIIGGGLSKAGEVLLAPLRAELAGRLRWREIPDIARPGSGRPRPVGRAHRGDARGRIDLRAVLERRGRGDDPRRVMRPRPRGRAHRP